jgi:hypothetical protein
MRQAIWRKMKKVGIPDDQAEIGVNLMRRLESTNDLTLEESIDAIQKDDRLCNESWPRFWKYLRATWLLRYPPSLWRAPQIQKIERHKQTIVLSVIIKD